MKAVMKHSKLGRKKNHDFGGIWTRAPSYKSNALPLSQRVYSLTQLSEIGYKPELCIR